MLPVFDLTPEERDGLQAMGIDADGAYWRMLLELSPKAARRIYYRTLLEYVNRRPAPIYLPLAMVVPDDR